MPDKRRTIADLLSLKGKGQLTMLRVETLQEAEAAERAGIDMLSIPFEILGPAFREACPTVFAMPGKAPGTFITADDYIRAGWQALNNGGDAMYCAASLDIIRRLRAEGIPIIGHTGLIPSKATWTGGFRAVGKTLETALLVWRQVKELEEAGAIGAEIEVVPDAVASALSSRTSLFLISMGAGAGCDAQYVFGCDVLGETRGHVPRHSKVYRNFAAEYDRLQQERIAAFKEYIADVRSGAFPEEKHLVGIAPGELEQFLNALRAEN
jgi:3-methyl-2-oxobutanoate hydroxymethyltransferase